MLQAFAMSLVFKRDMGEKGTFLGTVHCKRELWWGHSWVSGDWHSQWPEQEASRNTGLGREMSWHGLYWTYPGNHNCLHVPEHSDPATLWQWQERWSHPHRARVPQLWQVTYSDDREAPFTKSSLSPSLNCVCEHGQPRQLCQNNVFPEKYVPR